MTKKETITKAKITDDNQVLIRGLDGLYHEAIDSTDIEQLSNIKDEEIDFSDIPEMDEDFWADAEVIMPEPKKSVHLRVDSDVFEWFKLQGKGHLTRMNAVLRSYYEAHRGVKDA